ncbi:hypothetical protein SEA_JAYCOOKIE_99 [Arthrobacter phage JayCookie]|uniref:Uncharacterized protein n=2 Tax=Klausavirus princesstrina TaxID=1984784 RepID=A0A1B1SG91_9CAUD|nr:hypothetical protein SEA_CONBOY_97 [Arthrobacter phage Conboy]ASZ73310.1 hypothetical protein SEA_JAYCOOKIE_99 [Arthrobacter phage JayCookie]
MSRRVRYLNRDARPWFITPAEQANIDSFAPPEEINACLTIVIPGPAKTPQVDAEPTTISPWRWNPAKAADPANPSPW